MLALLGLLGLALMGAALLPPTVIEGGPELDPTRDTTPDTVPLDAAFGLKAGESPMADDVTAQATPAPQRLSDAGTAAPDAIFGDARADEIGAGAEADHVDLGDGAAARDFLDGGAGDDGIAGGAGDVVHGGGDVFVLRSLEAGTPAVIADFDAEQDQLMVLHPEGAAPELTVEKVPGGLLLRADGAALARLDGVAALGADAVSLLADRAD